MKRTILILICLIFITSCASNSGNNSNNIDWRTGTEGITMSFMADNPPSEVISKSKIPIIVKYANKGAYNVNDLSFYLTGYDPSILGFSPKSQVLNLDIGGKDQFNTGGSQEAYAQWEAPPAAMSNIKSVDNFKQSLSVTACYTYQTIANPTICIDPNKYSYVAPSKCTFDIKDLGSSQGAPIAVTSVTQKTTDDEIYLEITIENKGTGTPYLVGNCLSLAYTDINKISLQEVSMSNGKVKFTCNPKELRLDSNKAYAICVGKLPSTGSFFQTPLNIKISYKYRDTLPTKEITIVNI
jgi:hypothetical protein